MDGTGENAQFVNPAFVLLAAASTILYVSDYGAGCVRKIDTTTAVVTTLACELSSVSGMWEDSASNLYVGLGGDHGAIYKFAGGESSYTVFVGAVNSFGDQDGLGTSALLWDVSEMWGDKNAGYFFFTERFGCRIRQVTLDGLVTTFAGTGYNDDEYPADQLRGNSLLLTDFNYPTGIDGDSNGNLFVAEVYGRIVR